MFAVVFPGQGSQRPGMGEDLVKNIKEAQDVFDEASEATSLDLKGLCFDSTEEELRKTENAQIALYTCGLAAWSALKATIGADADSFAGHSVGEYAAIVAAGALSIGTGARLVRQRGLIMSVAGKSKHGTMAAVLGLDRDILEQVCQEVTDKGVCVIANDNSPGQLVISGDTDAVHAVSALAGEMGAKRVIPLNVSGAFHSPLMEKPASEMGATLGQTNFAETAQKQQVYTNVTSLPVTDSTQWPELLEKQLMSPVRWTESIQNMVKDGHSVFVECGVGEVLCGLIRRIEKGAQTFKVVDVATLEETAAQMRMVVA
ncbi:MAG: ACP S-malonyltransferase [Chthonomonadaceae bacterium]|nr:ACP S-malonyltransferase [Chthonomonadaceae bacterium]